MKRSKMLEEIIYILDDNFDNDLLNSTQAERILSMIIREGMSPPPYEGVFANGKKYDPETDQGRDTHYFISWEPEDE